MSDRIKDGGPAFPLPLGTANCAEPEQSGGLSARDYFAAKAMHAALTHGLGNVAIDDALRQIADLAYKAADAMLEAREAPQ